MGHKQLRMPLFVGGEGRFSQIEVIYETMGLQSYSGKRDVSSMPSDAIYKTVYQYNKIPLSQEEMGKLVELAEDYKKVKNHVYQRYGGIRSLPKLYPGYTVQNEMTADGLRTQLALPSVYFYCAIFDALRDVKSQWSQVKNRVEDNIKRNPNLTPEDRHYLRFVMKQSQCFEAVLLEREIVLAGEWKKAYEEVRSGRNERYLRQYLRRQVRKHLKKMHTEQANGFSVTQKGYRYGDHGIYLSTKEPRKRLFILLTDNNHYGSQIYIRLDPQRGNLKISVPIEMEAKKFKEYQNRIGLSVGMREMFVTDGGNVYGGAYGAYQEALTEYVREGTARYRKNRKHNSGREKYHAGKKRLEAALHNYVNAEINRMLKAEKPAVIYMPKLPEVSKAGKNKKINYSVSMWQRGYIKGRLRQKCQERSIEFVEVFGKDVGRECSGCGGMGTKTEGNFVCPACGLRITDRENAARNVKKRGEELKKHGNGEAESRERERETDHGGRPEAGA